MSFTTRCPACGTTFKVVPDQLKISDGWVRCGHCADVFDARLYLENWTPPPAEAAVPAAQEPEAALDAAKVVGQAAPDASQHTSNDGLVPLAASTAPDQPAADVAEATSPDSSATDSGVDLDSGSGWQPPNPPASLESPQEPMTPWSAGEQGVPVPADEAQAVNRQEQAADVKTRPVDVQEPPAPIADAVDSNADTSSAEADPEDAQASSIDSVFDEEIGEPSTPDRTPTGDEMPAPEAAAPFPPSDPAKRNLSDEPDSDFASDLKRFAAGSSSVSDVERGEEPMPAESKIDAAAGSRDDHDGGDVDEVAREGEPAHALSLEPGFVLQARRRAFWQTPGMRLLLSLFFVALSGLLAVQWVLHERDRLAARHPAWAPVLTRMCEPLGCRLGPVRQIDAVAIESSSLVRRLGNFYSFDLVLKNASELALAVPALELTLTDTRDQVIVRRIFLPEEFPGTPPALPAQGSLSVSFRLSIDLNEATPMAGYRALVFYP